MSIREDILDKWGRTVTRHPLITLVVCVLIAVGSAVTAFSTLELHADRSDLVSGDLDWSRRYAEYRQDFNHWDDLVLCIEGEPDDASIDLLARQVAERLGQHDRVESADAGFMASEAGPRLWKVADTAEFDQTLHSLQDARRLIAQPGPTEALVGFATSIQGSDHQSNAVKSLGEFIQPMLDGLEGHPVTFDLTARIENDWQSLTTGSGVIRTVLVQMHRDPTGGIEAVGDDLSLVRQIASDVIDATAPGTPWGVTGVPALEADETTQAITDSTRASIIAFVLVTLMMLLVFKRITIPLLVAASLLVGLAWSFGWVVVSIGHLQLLSVVFSAILIGLGVDFALHLLARMRVVHMEYNTIEDTIARSFRDAGPALITGTVTTAVAFACTAFTDFKGVAEMGVIAGGGVILLLIAMLSLFPATLAIGGRWRQRIERVHSWGDDVLPVVPAWADRHAFPVLFVTTLVVVTLLIPMSRVGYDSNILNLQPSGLESTQWQQRLEQDAGANIWSGLVLTTPDAAPHLVTSLQELDHVAGVGGMGMLFSPDATQRESRIAAVRAELIKPNELDTPHSALIDTLKAIAGGLRSRSVADPAAQHIADDIEHALHSWSQADDATHQERHDTMDTAWTRGIKPLQARVQAALEPGAPGADELPAVLRESWIGQSGQWLLRVEPTIANASILEPDRLSMFIESVRTVAPDVLGAPVQILESSRLISYSYRLAAAYAFIAVLVVLLLDFRSFITAGLAICPVLIGFVGVFGVMGLVGMKVNFANLMVLPLIFGIGVDAGVHAVHRWQRDPKAVPAGLVGGTGQAITLTMATTMIGFGSLLVAEHRGIRSLSIVMVTGLGITWLACMFVLPAALRFWTNMRGQLGPRSSTSQVPRD